MFSHCRGDDISDTFISLRLYPAVPDPVNPQFTCPCVSDIGHRHRSASLVMISVWSASDLESGKIVFAFQYDSIRDLTSPKFCLMNDFSRFWKHFAGRIRASVNLGCFDCLAISSCQHQHLGIQRLGPP